MQGDLPWSLPTPGGPHGDQGLCQHLLRVVVRPPPQPQGLRPETRAGGTKPLRQEDYHTF